MKPQLLIHAIASMLVGMSGLLAGPAEELPPRADFRQQIDSYIEAHKPTKAEQLVVDKINAYRARYKLPPVHVDLRLMDCARDRARRTNGSNVHFPNGHSCGRDASACGYAWSAIAENAAWDFPQNPPSTAVGSWAQSSGHAKAMRGPYNEVGIGYHKGTWNGQTGNWIIAIFGRRSP